MRTSRISHDTHSVLRALRTRRSTRSSAIESNIIISSETAEHVVNVEEHGSDSSLSPLPACLENGVEDKTTTPLALSSRKRKRGDQALALAGSTQTRRGSFRKTAPASDLANNNSNGIVQPARKARRQPAKKVVTKNGFEKVEPPPNWEEMYNLTKAMRLKVPAPVDTMGCESLAEEKRSPCDKRFQTLIALMLSSQTKDTVTAVAMKNLQENLPGGFTLESILSVSREALNELIIKVGFHNNKTRYIKAVAEILRDQYNSDIPDTIQGLMSLPGVGPKMAYLCMSAAWGRDEGIGVDVHVHRITNLWRWHKTNTPEETRAALESWLPREKWHDINHLLVGFGQTICLPVGRKCGECTLAEKVLCPSAVVAVKTKTRTTKQKVFKLEPGTRNYSAEVKENVAIEEEEVALGELFSPGSVKDRQTQVRDTVDIEDL